MLRPALHLRLAAGRCGSELRADARAACLRRVAPDRAADAAWPGGQPDPGCGWALHRLDRSDSAAAGCATSALPAARRVGRMRRPADPHRGGDDPEPGTDLRGPHHCRGDVAALARDRIASLHDGDAGLGGDHGADRARPLAQIIDMQRRDEFLPSLGPAADLDHGGRSCRAAPGVRPDADLPLRRPGSGSRP